MAKRKRGQEPAAPLQLSNGQGATKLPKTDASVDVKTPGLVVQIAAGSYERILHGMTASISDLADPKPSVDFADSFLFNAHASAIRCLAISPLPQDGSLEATGVYLATGGSDERVNIYSLSTSPMVESEKVPVMPTLGNNKISENPGNRELGSIMQHSSNITALHFPTRSKLLSASEDNTINITRIRDLSVVSTIKAPRPKVQGQPSGDTAPPGATPAGINDFAIHPSTKLMISVGRGERSMRLWNLVTGKKAGVLNFDRSVLMAVKEGKYSSGEGRRIRWNVAGTEFAISFERGVIVFGEDVKPICAVLPQPLTKVHQIAYVLNAEGTALLATSTEDGRIIFYNTSQFEAPEDGMIPRAKVMGQIKNNSDNKASRIKDFKILSTTTGDRTAPLLIVAASSDGSIKLWRLEASELKSRVADAKVSEVGALIGSYETGNRITCLDAFVMLPPEDAEAGMSEFEGLTETEDDDSDGSSDSDDEV